MTFEIDPLLAKQSLTDEVAQNAIKREITNILDSYVGWFDPFAELIQNALDSIDERMSQDGTNDGLVRVVIDLGANTLTVTDNGTGLSKDKFEKFLAPSFSFKSGATRGHKGVGATYLAYGFNDIQVATRHTEFEACGRMIGARNWLLDRSPSGNPKLRTDHDGAIDDAFGSYQNGVSVTVSFDKTTKPSKLSWLQAKTASQWAKILSVKTGLGCIPQRDDLKAVIVTRTAEGAETNEEINGLSYFWPHQALRKSKSIGELLDKQASLLKKHGPVFQMPSNMRNLDAVYFSGGIDEIEAQIELQDDERDFIRRHNLYMYSCFVYSAKVWAKINEKMSIRAGQAVLSHGIQVAANNMPQGEMFQVPLTKNIGRQRQLHFVFHVENVRSDLGRKGFQKDIVDFLQTFAARFFRSAFQKHQRLMKAATGTQVDLDRSQQVDDWKKEFEEHERGHPLDLVHEAFFLPKRHISITSIPTREQDVIALFNQLVAGGVIRGIEIMSTNERFTYDGMFRIVFGSNEEQMLYNADDNPLGVDDENWKPEFRSGPKILEYKFDLDGLIEDIESDVKNTNDIDLVVVWSVGDEYLANYQIISLIDDENVGDRQYHGVTHTVHSAGHGQKEFDLIVLEDLIGYLNNPVHEVARQRAKYDEV
ncbi:hypothetical protein [Maricaulis sp.]|uniref:hypothetical protein n=1 Tax=Maricaulis sp. TaxID=1486257 RepID=UPI001B2843E4|nr:hypothetical protein [Maricaulis sp.]MBO6796307.1 ATP-binding protein [Maricaulis sp.]